VLKILFPANIWLVYGNNAATLRKSDYSKIKIDQPALDAYKVYTDNEEIARKILQPVILQKIDFLNNKLKEEKLTKEPAALHFNKHVVQIAIPTSKKLFEPKLSKSINSETFIAQQTLLLNVLYNLTHDLTLD